MIKKAKIATLAGSVLLVLAVVLGLNVRGVEAAGDGPQDPGAYRQMDVYGQVLQHIQSDYVVTPNMDAVTNGALRGLLESLDADSSYLTAADYKAYEADKGGKAQVGLNISKRYGYATIVSVVPGGPADKANLNDGDIIEFIGKQNTNELSVAMIELLLEGVPGSQVELSVIRPRKADPDKIVLTRAVVNEPPVQQTVYNDSSILYLQPEVLDKEHVNQIEAKLKAMPKSGSRKVLLDLRDVSTGEMPQAFRLANFFLASGTIATLEGQKFPKQTFSANEAGSVNTTAPMVVLVNRGTAGPAEVVAAALQSDKRASLVGERTFGEGSQQKTFVLPDGAALILSVAKYETPAGKALEDDAVTPGTIVASPLDDLTLSDEDANATPKKPSQQPDAQLNKALEILKAKTA
jgi:carboxyl-terminal processing protease